MDGGGDGIASVNFAYFVRLFHNYESHKKENPLDSSQLGGNGESKGHQYEDIICKFAQNNKSAAMSVDFMQQQLDLFSQRLPHKPYCTDDLAAGLKIRNQDHAKRAKYIQHNPPPAVAWLVFDVDSKASADNWIAANLPPPAWVTINPKNGHCHIVYGLVSPVARTDAAHASPLRLCAAVEAAYREVLGADRGYTGLITKNPLNRAWRVWMPPSSNDGIYELGELAEYVTLPNKLPKRDAEIGIGRNVTLFDTLRKWAYKAVTSYWRPGGVDKWFAAVDIRALEINDTSFADPLPLSEIRGISRSVAKWVWKNMTPSSLQELIERTHSSEIQSVRGIKSGEVRRKGSISEAKPWESMGISRATWYRKGKPESA